MPTTSAQQSHAENIRLVIAKQSTVAGSLQALLRAISATMHEAVEKGDPGGLEAFADHIDADPKAWSDAVMANTPMAIETVLPISGVSPDTQQAFASHAVQAQPQEPPVEQQQAHAQPRREDQAQARREEQSKHS